MNCEQRCRLEVEQLHAFFQDWFRGDLPDTDEAFDRFACVMAAPFEMVAPDGASIDRAAILDIVRKGYGKEPEAKIRIDKFRHRFTIGNVSLVMYEEWQEWGGSRRGRLSSALLETNDDAPNGVRWLHVHETWLEK